jgi:hypothetical protein
MKLRRISNSHYGKDGVVFAVGKLGLGCVFAGA